MEFSDKPPAPSIGSKGHHRSGCPACGWAAVTANRILPDIENRSTIEGIQNGKDEVLEGAIEYLQGETDNAQ